MLKKIAIVSSIVLVVCLIAFTAMFPIAVSDSVKLAQQAAPAYSVLSELMQYSSENVESVELIGSWIDSLEVRPSVDNKIHILTDNYRIPSATFVPYFSENGKLQLHCKIKSSNAISMLTRENIQRSIIASLNDASVNRIILELPASVSFISDPDSSTYYYRLRIDERVNVFDDEESSEDDEITINAPETEEKPESTVTEKNFENSEETSNSSVEDMGSSSAANITF